MEGVVTERVNGTEILTGTVRGGAEARVDFTHT